MFTNTELSSDVPGIGELRRHGEFVPIEFDRVVARHADAGSCNDLAALERAVELRATKG